MRHSAINLLLIIFLTPVLVMGQEDKNALEKKRSQLIQDIELTSKLVNQAKKKSEATLSDFQLMETQLKKRRQLVDVLNSELESLKKRSQVLRDSIDFLERTINREKKEYGLILNKAHVKARLDHPFQYLVNGASIFEGFQKWIYLRQLRTYIFRKLDGLRHQTQLLSAKSNQLQALVLQQSENLKTAQENKLQLEKEAVDTKEVLNKIKSNVKSLETKLSTQRKERKKLNDAIEKLILAELEKNRKKKETNTLPEAEIAALSSQFEKNKGRLPWPVRKGVITSRFGRHSHPDISGVYVDNTGIDLVTDENATVQVVLGGTVVGTSRIAGHQNMVIVNHGEYYTVYSKLASVSVNEGQNLDTGQEIGRTSRAVDGLGNFHFEIWKGKTKVNPEHWIKR